MAPASKIAVWNMALGWVGTRTVASETEHTQEAVQCGLYWDNARRQCLRDYPWSFARMRAVLAEIPVPQGWDEYAHAYALPDDCLKILAVRTPGMARLPRRQSAYMSVALDKQGGRRALLTDAVNPVLQYIADVDNPELFDDLFIGVLARKLAAMIAVPLLKNNTAKVNELEQLYRAAIPAALEADAAEEYDAPVPDAWLAARQGVSHVSAL